MRSMGREGRSCQAVPDRERGVVVGIDASKRGRARARYLLCHMALVQTRKGGLWHEWAQALRAKGKRTGEIRAAVARKLLALLYALARDRAVHHAQRWVTGDGATDGLVFADESRQVCHSEALRRHVTLSAAKSLVRLRACPE